jgi:anti-anti-sigma factor
MSTDHTVTADGDREDEAADDSQHGFDPLPSLSSFWYRVSHRDGVLHIVIRGAVEDEDAGAFMKALFQSGDPNDSGDIALDLGDVPFISESALAVLIRLLKAQRAQGFALHLTRLSPWIRRKLERTAIIQFFAVDG